MKPVLATLVLAVAACLAAPAQLAHSQGLDSINADLPSRLQALVDQAVQQPGAVGLSLAVARGEEIVLETGAGIADLEWNAPADADTVFRIGSITKQFTAAATMRLVENGDLDLDDEVLKHLPDLDLGDRHVTIRQLLTHTSGILDFEGRSSPEAAQREGGAPQGLYTSVDGVQFDFRDVPFRFEPGEGFEYSNANYFLLGLVIEAVDGRSFWQFLQEEFLTPLNMHRTRDGSERDIILNRAQGYTVDRTTDEILNDPPLSIDGAFAAGALVSTAGDLLRWQIALTRGRVVEEASFRQMTGSALEAGGPNSRYGFGLEMRNYGGLPSIGHSGGIPGFISMLMWLPDQDLHIAVISNSQAIPRSILRDIHAVLISSELSGSAPPQPVQPSQQ